MLAGAKHMKSMDFAWWMAKLKLFQSKVHVHEYHVVLSLSWITREIKHIFVPPESNFVFCQESWLKKATKKNNQERFVSKINLNCE